MYSHQIPEDKKDMYAMSRAEDVEASYKDLAEVCGRIRNKNAAWAISFLGLAADGAIPVLFKRNNKNLGHRRELGGRKGRYPMKAAKAVLKALNSAIANSVIKGLSEDLVVIHACANMKHSYPRLQAKGRRFRQAYQTARIEIIVKEKVETPVERRKERAEKAKKVQKPKEVPASGTTGTALPASGEKHEHPHEHAHEPHTHEPKTAEDVKAQEVQAQKDSEAKEAVAQAQKKERKTRKEKPEERRNE